VAEVVMIAAGTLPKTTSGKAQRQKTKEAYLKGRREQAKPELVT
jgi:acyl-CoA synthetase (AMP-forming)/AMP-acid ligase II